MFWEIFGYIWKYLRNIWIYLEIFEKYLGNIWKILGKYLGKQRQGLGSTADSSYLLMFSQIQKTIDKYKRQKLIQKTNIKDKRKIQKTKDKYKRQKTKQRLGLGSTAD